MAADTPPADEATPKQKRISITKSQSQSVAAVELIALCQTVTEDGSLSAEEVKGLERWLKDNRDTDLPAIAFLSEAVQRILADGKVTDAERRALHEAIEAVLPTDLRRSVKKARQERQRLDKAQAKLERELNREQARALQEQNSPHADFDFMVAGVHAEGREKVVERYAKAGDPVDVAREPANRFSRHAVQVLLTNGEQIGYVPEEDARELAPLLDAGMPYTAEIKKILTGGRVPRPVVVLDVYHKDAQVPGLKTAGTRESSGTSTSGCLTVMVVAIAVTILLVVLLV